MNPPEKVHIGVVGGGFGSVFEWHKHPHCAVEAVCDPIPEKRQRLMQVYGCGKAYENLRELAGSGRSI